MRSDEDYDRLVGEHWIRLSEVGREILARLGERIVSGQGWREEHKRGTPMPDEPQRPKLKLIKTPVGEVSVVDNPEPRPTWKKRRTPKDRRNWNLH